MILPKKYISLPLKYLFPLIKYINGRERYLFILVIYINQASIYEVQAENWQDQRLETEPCGHRDGFRGGHCREQKRGRVEKAVRPHGRPNRAVAPRQNAQTRADASRDDHAQTALVDVA